PQYHRREFIDGDLSRVAKVDRHSGVGLDPHKRHEAFDQIRNVTERTRLFAAAVDGERSPSERLADEVRNDAAIIGLHPRPVRIEDPRNAGIGQATSQEIEAEGLCRTLALVVARAWART